MTVLGALTMIVALLLGTPHGGSTRPALATQSQRYVTAPGGVDGVCAHDPVAFNPTGLNLGAVCFQRTPGSEVEIVIADASGMPVGGWAVYVDSRDRFLGPANQLGGKGWPICGRDVIPTVDGWSTLYVYVGTLDVATACSALDVVAPTTGFVTANFSTGLRNPRRTALRAGTILDGENVTGPIGGCGTMPDCAVWRASGCDPALAGRNPALYSSIVNVASLADGATERFFEGNTGNPVGVKAGGMMIEFYSHDCQRMPPYNYYWDVNCHGFPGTLCTAEFTIRRGVKWMTVTSNGNAHMMWTLS